MGQTESYQRRLMASVASYDPEKYAGEWWEIAVSSGIPPDQDSDELFQKLTWNSETKKMEVVMQGFKDGEPNPYTINYSQFQSWDSNCPGRMKVHRNGVPTLFHGCLNWTNYDQFAIWTSLKTGCIHFQSRQRTLSSFDHCMLAAVLEKIGIDPHSLQWRPKSFDQSLPATELKGEGTKVIYW